MPLKASEAFIKTTVLASVSAAVAEISVGEWGNVSTQFDLTLDVRCRLLAKLAFSSELSFYL